MKFKERDRVRDPETGMAGEIYCIIRDQYYINADDGKEYSFYEDSRWAWIEDTGPSLEDIYKLQCIMLRRMNERWSGN